LSEPPKRDAEPSVHEAHLEAVLESVSDVFYALDADWRYVVFNRAAEEFFRVSRSQLLGKVWQEVWPPGRDTPFERHLRAVMENGGSRRFETTFPRLRPGRTVEVRFSPMRGGGAAVTMTDVTERRQAEDALKAALARSEMILESISDAFYAVDEQFRFTYVNRVAEAWWGRSRESLLGLALWEAFPTTKDSVSQELHLAARGEHKVVRAEFVSPILGRWIDVSIFPTESGLSVYFRDITERKLAEERQQLLVHELNHRVKNALATVQAIAAQSLKGEEVPAQARERFTERLMSLARANDVLVRGEWEGAELAEVAAQVASPYAGADERERFEISGPPILLSASATTALALALHELATNAAKYGALSRPEGRVTLSWRLDGTGPAQRFRLTWRESGGPPTSPPTRTGFGTRLISRGLSSELNAEVQLDYRPAGLVLTLTAPLGDSLQPLAPALADA
jgi:PAS domain S-box-containing protein